MPTLAERQRLLSVDEYHAMAEAGILSEEDRLELLDGKIIAMTPIGGPHISCVIRLQHVLAQRLYAQEQPAAFISSQNLVRLHDHSEPESDVVLLRPRGDRTDVPQADEVLLLIEVASTSLDYDREEKVPRYAAAGIPEVWIVALDEGCVEVYRRPEPAHYAEHEVRHRGDTLTIAALPSLKPLPVEDVLGR